MQEEFPLNKLVLFDIDEKRQEPIGKFGDILFGEKMPGLDFSYTTNAEEAYKDMDFIFMQMRAGGRAGTADIADGLPLRDGVALGNCKAIQVSIQGYVTVAVVNHDAVAVTAVPACHCDLAAVGGVDACTLI